MGIALIMEIVCYLSHADRKIDQISRRVIVREKIPHNEKVFSIFEEHREWINKSKAGMTAVQALISKVTVANIVNL